MKKLKVFIAEDHTILREGLKSLLQTDSDIEIVGEAVNGHEAIQSIIKLCPDLVLMDLSMPHINGTEVINSVKRREPDIKIIALTVHKSEEYVRATLNAKADGYVLKEDTHQELLTAIKSVMNGKIFLSPGICGKVLTGFLDKNNSSQIAETSWDLLTERERQVIKLIAEGSKNAEIADRLSLSIKTVEKHRSNLMRKLDLHNASAITSYAIENGLIG
ncbi:MAG: response regulator transcription factor [Chromatiales bacterium]|nr:response regulator transcription factor [Chromatiales bacterium]